MLSFSLPPAPQLGERKSCPWTLCCYSASWLCKAYMPVVCVWRHGRHCNCTHVQSNVIEYEEVAVLSNLLFSIFAYAYLIAGKRGPSGQDRCDICSTSGLWSLLLAWLPAIVHRFIWIIDPCVWNDTQCAGDWYLYPCLCMGYGDIVRQWEC